MMEALLEVISCQRLNHALLFGQDLFNAVKMSPLDLQFHFQEWEKSQGARSK